MVESGTRQAQLTGGGLFRVVPVLHLVHGEEGLHPYQDEGKHHDPRPRRLAAPGNTLRDWTMATLQPGTLGTMDSRDLAIGIERYNITAMSPTPHPSARLSGPLLLLAVLVTAVVTAAAETARAEPLGVFVSVLPLKTFVEAVGGEHVAVETMVRPGFSPATYDPTPQQIGALARARLYVRAGVPFEAAWMARIRGANPDMTVLDARQGIDLRPLPHHDHGDDGHGHGDPGEGQMDAHVWTSPLLARTMAANIRDALTTLDPAHADVYAANYRAFATEMEDLDQEIRDLLGELRHRRFMVFHPAWGYFAAAYDLEQVPIEYQGKQPGARALAALIERARAEGVKVVFVQPQFDRKAAAQVARAIGGRVEAMDPLAADYQDNLRRVARLIAAAGRP